MHIVIPIIRDDACLFRSLSYFINNNQVGCYHIRENVVLHVIEDWYRFSVFSEYNSDDNYPDSKSYYMSQHWTYAIKLATAGELFIYICQYVKMYRIPEDTIKLF